jgi:hypothetical protein
MLHRESREQFFTPVIYRGGGVAYFSPLTTVSAFSTPSLVRALLSTILHFIACLRLEETSLIFDNYDGSS